MRTPWIVRKLRELRVHEDRRLLRHVKSELQKAIFKAGGSSRKRGEPRAEIRRFDKSEIGITTDDDPSNGW